VREPVFWFCQLQFIEPPRLDDFTYPRYHLYMHRNTVDRNDVQPNAKVNNTVTILVVDDDARIRDLLCSSLKGEGFDVVEAGTSDEVYAQLDDQPIDLITMDVLLDKENGLDLVRDIRKLSEIPIILVTGRVDLIDTVLGLELGADDYITKPFIMRELIARTRSVLRRSRVSLTARKMHELPAIEVDSETLIEFFRFGDRTLIPASRELRDTQGELINLTTSEYDLLEIFVTSPQRVLSREHLMERLSGRNSHSSDRLVDNHVAQLRKKIECEDGVEWIKTVRGAGYMFTGKVTRDSQPYN